MKLDDTRAEQLRTAGLLHNIGLFGLPEDLLLATGKLNSIAQSRLAEHPARGEEALAAIPEFEEMASWVRWHHERPMAGATRTSCGGPDPAGGEDSRGGSGLRRDGAGSAPPPGHELRGGEGEAGQA